MKVKTLIEKENNDNPYRGNGYENVLSYIKVDDELVSYIQKQGFGLDSLLDDKQKLQLRGNSNTGSGGTIADVSDIIHPDIKNICIQAAHSLGLGMAGVDILTKDITKPLVETGGVILEVNATPGIGWNKKLTNVNTGKEILKRLFF